MRAFGYVRLSKESEDTTSPQRQRERINALCADRGWELVETFEDIDVSAFNGKHRPAFSRMMNSLGEADAIVFWKLDRLSRSSVEAGQIAESCKAAGVNLVATDMNIDTTSAGGKFVYTVLAAAGEMEAGTTSERSKAMHAYKRAHDEPVGRVPFGWKRVGKHHERDEEQQAILEQAARRYIAGNTFNQIAKDLGMYTAALSRMLQSERVFEALPDDVSGPLAEAILARKGSRVPTSAQSLLGGIARCGECGSSMSVTSTRAGRKGKWYSYGCRTAGHVHISAPWLDDYVTAQVLEAIDTGKLLDAIRRRRRPGRTRKASELEARLEHLDSLYVEGKVSKARFEKMQGGLLDQLAAAQQTERSSGIDLPAELARNLTERWSGFEIATRRRIIGAVVERVEVSKAVGHGTIDPERVEVVWRT